MPWRLAEAWISTRAYRTTKLKNAPARVPCRSTRRIVPTCGQSQTGPWFVGSGPLSSSSEGVARTLVGGQDVNANDVHPATAIWFSRITQPCTPDAIDDDDHCS